MDSVKAGDGWSDLLCVVKNNDKTKTGESRPVDLDFEVQINVLFRPTSLVTS